MHKVGLADTMKYADQLTRVMMQVSNGSESHIEAWSMDVQYLSEN